MKMKFIGMVHLDSLDLNDGYNDQRVDKIVSNAIKDISALQAGGVDEIMLENNGDSELTEFIGEAKAALFATVVERVKNHIKVPFGYTVLLNDWKSALTLAKLSGGSFIRIDTFVDKVKRVDDGIILDPKPDEIIAFRKKIGGENIKIYTDIHVKHTELVAVKSIKQSTTEALNHGSDGIIVTGSWTGKEANISELRDTKAIIDGFAHDGKVPLIIGSGVNELNVSQYVGIAETIIVGTAIKRGERIDKAKVKAIKDAIDKAL